MSEHRAALPWWDPRTYGKALAALLAPGVPLLVAALAQGEAPSAGDWRKALAAMLAAAFAVYVVGNRDRQEAPTDA
ncbi:MAG: hypothetical protein P1U38_09890 [Aeromicrobium sp.]|uniref:hypothetical protein n=1 Tax=Aeromicrobium sp. TaxID=1871063 RepID=UPI002604E761|nr:hypothetical protein [Aeromicrobium sp.]MDF1705073.1 hypothetical protein [Aeromicrobium sp.]